MKEQWIEEFEEKAKTGVFGGHFRDEEVDWDLVKDFIRKALASKRETLAVEIEGFGFEVTSIQESMEAGMSDMEARVVEAHGKGYLAGLTDAAAHIRKQ